MSYNPDPIFRDGLNGYRKPAPSSAWERIESGLDRKRRKSVWLKVAAGLVLLIATSVMLFQHNQTESAIASVSKESTPITLKSDSTIAVATESSASYQLSAISYQSLEANNSKSTQSDSIVERTSTERSRSSRNDNLKSSRQSTFGRESSFVSREVVDSPNETQQISVVTTDDLLETPVSDIQIENPMEGSLNNRVVDQLRTSITYSAAEVNERFTKQKVTTEATPEKKNASGLQKVIDKIDKAVEFTNERAVYSELREKKNEWLSFNNLANKTESNK